MVTLLSIIEKILPAKISAAAIAKIGGLVDILANKSPDKTAERTALIAFAIRLFSAALAFLSQILLARAMGEFDYGIYVFVWVFVVIAGNLSCFGFHTSIIKFIPKYQDMNDIGRIRALTMGARIFSMTMATMVALFGFIFIYLFADLVPNYYLVPILLGLIALPMIALGDTLDGTSRAHSWPIIALSPTYIIRPILILILFLGAFLLGYAPDAKIALVCAISATYLTTLGQFLIVTLKLSAQYDGTDQNAPRTWNMGLWIKAALPIFVIESLVYLLTNADVLIVGLMLPPDQVAIYFAAAKTMALVHFVYFAVKASAGPRFSELAAANHLNALDTAAKQTATWTFVPTFVIGGTVLALGYPILLLFGSAFTNGYPVMAILFVGILIKSLVGPGEVLLMMVNQQRICAGIYGLCFSCNLMLNFMLIPKFGIFGAAMATAGAMIIEALLLIIVIKIKVGITMFALTGNVMSKIARQADKDRLLPGSLSEHQEPR